jgi:F-box and WD-40 domain protein CDC4
MWCNANRIKKVLDFGAARDGVPKNKLGRRILVDESGREMDDALGEEDLEE